MLPDDLIRAGNFIKDRWSDGAMIYAPRFSTNPPNGAILLVDHDENLVAYITHAGDVKVAE